MGCGEETGRWGGRDREQGGSGAPHPHGAAPIRGSLAASVRLIPTAAQRGRCCGHRRWANREMKQSAPCDRPRGAGRVWNLGSPIPEQSGKGVAV